MRGSVVFGVLVMVVPVLAGCIFDGDLFDPADDGWMLMDNGRVWTADDAMPWAGAIAVKGDRILDVAADAATLIERHGEPSSGVDLGGRLVTPGFIDTHNHFVREAAVRDASTWETNPYEPREPGYDPVMGPVNQNRIAAGHIATWNQRNLERVQNGEAPSPPGYAHGHAHDHDHGVGMTDMGPWPRPGTIDVATWADTLQVALQTANRFGVTSSTEAGATLEALTFLGGLSANDELSVRFNLYFFPEELADLEAKGLTTGSGDGFARVLGIKIYSDGWLGPRTAAMRDLFADRPHQGFAFYTQQEMNAYVEAARQAGFKLTAHAIGDRATDMMLSAYEQAFDTACRPDVVTLSPTCDDPRFSLEHVSVTADDLVDRMVALDLAPSVQLSFPTSDAPWIEDAIGPERVDVSYRWKTFLERGLTVGGSSDWPIEVLPPLWGVERAVTRMDLNGEPVGGFQPDEALTVDEALRLITINAAYLQHRDHELGSITPGKLADIVVLDRDIFTVDPETIADTEVVLTLVGGEFVHALGSWVDTTTI